MSALFLYPSVRTPLGKLLTLSVSAVPPAVEPRVGLTVLMVGVLLVVYARVEPAVTASP